MPMANDWGVLPQAELKDFHARIQENWADLIKTLVQEGVHAPDYHSPEAGLGHFEWVFRHSRVTLVVAQTVDLEFQVSRYPEDVAEIYDSEDFAEVVRVVKQLQDENEKKEMKEESKDGKEQ